MRHKNVYRTILVPEDATFSDLLVYQMVVFGLNSVKEPIFESNKVINQNELVKNWFQQIGDEVNYKYENQQPIFKFLLEKRIVIPLNSKYPICLNGNGNLLIGNTGVINLNYINEQLKKLVNQPVNEAADTKKVDKNIADIKPDFAQLLKVADNLKKLKPWNDIDEERVIALEGNTYFAKVLGSKGERFGIELYDEPNQTASAKFIVSFVNRDDLSKEDYQLIKENGFSFRGKNNWIQFRANNQGQALTLPKASDVNEIAKLLEKLANVLSNKEQLIELSAI